MPATVPQIMTRVFRRVSPGCAAKAFPTSETRPRTNPPKKYPIKAYPTHPGSRVQNSNKGRKPPAKKLHRPGGADTAKAAYSHAVFTQGRRRSSGDAAG